MEIPKNTQEEEGYKELFIFCQEKFRLYLTPQTMRKFQHAAHMLHASSKELLNTAKTFATSPYLRATTRSLNRLLCAHEALTVELRYKQEIASRITRYGLIPTEHPEIKAWGATNEEIYSWLGVTPIVPKEPPHPQPPHIPSELCENAPLELPHNLPIQERPREATTGEKPHYTPSPAPASIYSQARKVRRESSNHNQGSGSLSKPRKEGRIGVDQGPHTRAEYVAEISKLAKKRGYEYYCRFVRGVFPSLDSLEKLQLVHSHLCQESDVGGEISAEAKT